MSDSIAFLLAPIVGLVLGAIFFGGLWWTTGKAVTSQHVARWIIGSLALRIGIVTTGFYLISSSHWERFAGCLIGFVVARTIAIALTKRLRLRYGFAPPLIALEPIDRSGAQNQATNKEPIRDT